MSSRRVYFNGEFVAEDEARISIFDSALMFGDMVFEMTRTFGQKPYRLRDHLERLYASIDYAEIDLEMTIDEMEEATYATIEHNREALGEYDFQIMHDVTRGALGLYTELVPEGDSPIVTINVIPLVRHIGGMAEKYEAGAHFIIPQQQSVPARYIDPKVKSRSRIFYKRADLQVSRMEEGAMALLTDERGFVTEGTGNNFFMVKDGQILTPRPHDILRGISRGVCMELAEKIGRPVVEADLEPYDVRGRRGGLVHQHHHLHVAGDALRLPPRGGRPSRARVPAAPRRLVGRGGRRHRRPGAGVRRAGPDLDPLTRQAERDGPVGESCYEFEPFRPGAFEVPVTRVTPRDAPYVHTYYDVCPFSPSQRYLAATRLPFQDRVAVLGDEAQICVIDLREQSIRTVATTRCWGFQTGALLNWGATDRRLYTNDVVDGEARCVRIDLASGESTVFAGPMYHIAPDESCVIGFPLELLDATQPGYGVPCADPGSAPAGCLPARPRTRASGAPTWPRASAPCW